MERSAGGCKCSAGFEEEEDDFMVGSMEDSMRGAAWLVLESFPPIQFGAWSVMRSTMLFRDSRGPDAGGCGALIHGDKQCSSHIFGSKKSMSSLRLVDFSMKQRPSSGRRAKLVRSVKLTCAVRTRELRRTSSPLRRGPRMLTAC